MCTVTMIGECVNTVRRSVRTHCRKRGLSHAETQTIVDDAVAMFRDDSSCAAAIGAGKQAAEKVSRRVKRAWHAPQPVA